MNNLDSYEKEKIAFLERYETAIDDENKKIELRKFIISIRRYLVLALEIIENNLGVKYSITKKGYGMDSSFKKIESIINKPYSEVSEDLENLRNLKMTKELDEKASKQLDLALEVVDYYCKETI